MSGLESFFAQIMDIHPLADFDPHVQMLVWLIILLAAALNLLIGYGLRLPDSAVGGFLMGFYAISFFGSFGSGQNIWIVALIVGIMLGLLSLALYRLGESFLSFAALFATFASAGLLHYTEVGLVGLAAALVLSIIVLTPFGERPVMILVTSFCGAWWTVTSLLEVLTLNGYDLSAYLPERIYFWLRLGVSLLLAVLGMIIQAKTSQARAKRLRDKKARRGRDDDYGGSSSHGSESYTPVDYVGSDRTRDNRYGSTYDAYDDDYDRTRNDRCSRDYDDVYDYDYDRTGDHHYGRDYDADYDRTRGNRYDDVYDADYDRTHGNRYDDVYGADYDRTHGNRYSRDYDSDHSPYNGSTGDYDSGYARDYRNTEGTGISDTNPESGIREVNDRIAYEVARIYEGSKTDGMTDSDSGASATVRVTGNRAESGATKVFRKAGSAPSDLGETKIFPGLNQNDPEADPAPDQTRIIRKQ